jgi:proteasome lid subunit RPN8/RPN11
MQESLRVVGWYHSHPHIPVFPSHVDVKTQGSYQQFDVGFIGLIFSVFNKGKIQVCAFQSRKLSNGDWERIEVPLDLQTLHKPIDGELSRLSSVVSMQTLLSLQKISFNEGK